jgi:hypothetical protein
MATSVRLEAMGTRLQDGIDIRGDLNVTPAVAFLGVNVSE